MTKPDPETLLKTLADATAPDKERAGAADGLASLGRRVVMNKERSTVQVEETRAQMGMNEELVNLRNGTQEHHVAIAATMVALRALAKAPFGMLTVYEFAQLCRNPNHQIFGNHGQKLEELGLLKHGHVHESVRNIVLSAIEGDGLDMRLVDPRGGA